MTQDLKIRPSSSFLELAGQLHEVLYLVEVAHGELTPELETRLKSLESQFKEKPDAYKYVMDKSEQNVEYWTKLRDEIDQKIITQKNIKNRLIKNMNMVMDALGVEEIVGHVFRFKRSDTAGQVIVTDMAALPAEFKTLHQEWVEDKLKIREALKKGPVPGAELKKGKSIKSYLGEKT